MFKESRGKEVVFLWVKGISYLRGKLRRGSEEWFGRCFWKKIGGILLIRL